MPEGPFVLAGLPYPKGANNPGQSNMVGDYETVWEFHRTMIDRIYEKIPNLKKEWSIISGFSNGGHSIDGMLRVRDKKGALADYFGAFVLADGGGGYASEDGNYPSLEGKFAYVCWGETSANAANSEGVAKDFKSRRATTVASEMAETGHAFADFEQAKVKEWIQSTVMPAWGSREFPLRSACRPQPLLDDPRKAVTAGSSPSRDQTITTGSVAVGDRGISFTSGVSGVTLSGTIPIPEPAST